jgi:hypothetical protein
VTAEGSPQSADNPDPEINFVANKQRALLPAAFLLSVERKRALAARCSDAVECGARSLRVIRGRDARATAARAGTPGNVKINSLSPRLILSLRNLWGSFQERIMNRFVTFIFCFGLLSTFTTSMARAQAVQDFHSYANPAAVRVRHLGTCCLIRKF